MAYYENVRDYFAARLPNITVPDWFTHSSPTDPPQSPAYPSSLNAAERTEVMAWLQNNSFTLTLPNAIAKVAEYTAYFNLKKAWTATDQLARIAQFRLALADAHIQSYDTVPVILSTNQIPVSQPAAYGGSGSSSTARTQTLPGTLTPFTNTYNMGTGNELVPTGAVQVIIKIWGGGGSGGGGAGSQYGGASGGYSTKTIAIAAGDYGLLIPYTVGAGGLSATGTGYDGGASSIGSVALNAGTISMTANGGTGGTGAGGGTGGSASGGSTNTSGASGNTAKGGNAPQGGNGGLYAANGASPGSGGGPGSSTDTDPSGAGAHGRVQFIWS